MQFIGSQSLAEKIKGLSKKQIGMNNAFWLVVILILLALIVFGSFRYFEMQNDLNKAKALLEQQGINEKALYFANLFIEEVLEAEGEVDFETRLKLENAVRSLNDEEVFQEWQRFTESKTEVDAQENVKRLLRALIGKIKA